MTAETYKLKRKSLRLTQSALALKVGVSRETINNREHRRKPIGKEAQMAIDYLMLNDQGKS